MANSPEFQALEFQAGAAFGTGQHPSTIGALQAIGGLAGVIEPAAILDIGCGSGLLSLAAAHYWPGARIVASDIMQEAVETTRLNAEQAGLGGHIHAVRADGAQHAEIGTRAPYGLILCNIFAEPIIGMADDIARLHAPGGAIVLSGILAWRQWQVEEAFALYGLKKVEVIELGEWRTLILG